MRKISLWAHHHVWPTRFLLTAIHILLIFLAWILSSLQQEPFGWSLLLCASPFILSTAIFLWKAKRFSRKFHVFAATGSFWLVVCFFQSGGTLTHTFGGGIFTEAHASKTEDAPKQKKKKKVSFLKRITTDKTGRTVLAIVTILVALGLLFLVGALSCSIACSGADALAIIVGVAGLVGIIFATRAVLRRIKRGPPQKTEEGETIKAVTQ